MKFALSPLARALGAVSCIGLLAACQTTGGGAGDNPSPTAGSSTSQQANAMADKGMYKPIEYVNAHKKGPQLVVIPGEIKSNNASFTQKFGPNNIADYAELELGKANFRILERADLGPLLNEFTLAYTMGNPQAARKVLQKGKFKTTKWVVKFDILKAEPVAQATQGFDGRAIGNIIGIASGSRGGAAAGVAVGSVQTSEATGICQCQYHRTSGNRLCRRENGTGRQVDLGAGYFEWRVGWPDPGFTGAAPGAEDCVRDRPEAQIIRPFFIGASE
jgi:hypothetical protein